MYTLIARAAFKRSAAAASTRRVAGSRLNSSTVHDNDPQVLEREKRRNLDGVQHRTSTSLEKDHPGWNEYLASASEAAIKADQSSAPLADLQSVTVKHLKDRHSEDSKEGTSETLEATYEKEEIEGPLKGANVKDSVERSEYKVSHR